MSSSPRGILAYGFNLGHEEEISFDSLPWYDRELDFRDSVERTLLASIGFTETNWRVDGFSGRKREAKKRLGVEVVYQCSYDQPGFLLSAKTQTVEWGAAEIADLTVPDGADERLTAALALLGMTPKNPTPAWLLSSLYG